MRKLFDKKTAINEEIIQILFLSSMIFSNWYMDNALLILQKMRKEKTYSLGVKGKECVGNSLFLCCQFLYQFDSESSSINLSDAA